MKQDIKTLLLQLKSQLKQIITVLESSDSKICKDYLIFLNAIFHQIHEINYNDLIKRILEIYGGMNSFNDLIIYRNGKVLIAETDLLDTYRHELYHLCHKFANLRDNKITKMTNYDEIKTLLRKSLQDIRPLISGEDFLDVEEYIENPELELAYDLLTFLYNKNNIQKPAELLKAAKIMGLIKESDDGKLPSKLKER